MVNIQAEREARLKDLHPVFRELDSAVAAYIDLVRDRPDLTDVQLEEKLVDQGVERSLAFGCVAFVPLAFGRAVFLHTGIAVSDTYVEHDLAADQRTEKPLSEEFEFLWAKEVAHLYRQCSDYSEAFKHIALRSAELDSMNNALLAGMPEEFLRDAHIGPPTVFTGEPPKKWWQFWR